MANLILYDFIQIKEYTLKKFVDDYEKKMQDTFQGVIFHEYDNKKDLKKWKKKLLVWQSLG